MIDEKLLTDPTACPRCSTRLTDGVRCPRCHLHLHGPLAERVWTVSLSAADLLRQRSALIVQLAEQGDKVGGAVPAPRVVPAPARTTSRPGVDPRFEYGPPDLAAPAPRAAAPIHQPAPGGRRDTSLPQIKVVLLGLGALLLVVAAVIFTVVAWGRMGVGGRAACLALATAAGVVGAELATRRRLRGTAEALASVSLVLALLDAYALRRLDVLGLGSVGGLRYWAAATAVVALAAGVWALLRPLHVTRLAAVGLAQLPVWLLLPVVDDAWRGALLVTQAAALGAVAAAPDVLRGAAASGRGMDLVTSLPVRALAAFGLLPAWTAAAVIGGMEGVDGTGAVAVRGVAVLLATSAVAGALAVVVRAALPRETAAGAGGLTLLAAAAICVRHTEITASYQPVAVLLVICAFVAALLALPVRRRTGAAAAAAGAAVLAVVGSLPQLVLAAVGPFGWALQDRWTVDLPAGAERHVAPSTAWDGTAATLAVGILGTAVAALLLRALTDDWRPARYAGLAGAALLLPVVAVAADAPLALATCGGVLLGGAAIVLTVMRERLAGLAAASWVTGLFLAWAAANDATTLVALPLAGGAVVAAALLAQPRMRPGLCAAAVALIGLDVAAVARAAGAPEPRAAFLVVLAAVLVVAATTAAARRLGGPDRLAAEIAAAAVAAIGLAWASSDAGWLAHSLTVAGVGAAAMAVRADRRNLRYAGAALLTLASFVRWSAGGDLPVEAYVAGPALVLLALGELTRRERARAGLPLPSSWVAFGPGLSLALLPSLGVAIGDDGLARPLLLGLAALVAVLAGTRLRLQAPLVLGAGVLAIDAIVQVAPYAAALPRWVAVGAVGLTLLGLGATYERRIEEARRVQGRVARLG